MDSGDIKSSERPENISGVDVLTERLGDRFELYQTMAKIFFDYIPDEDKVKAMADVIDLMKGTDSEG